MYKTGHYVRRYLLLVVILAVYHILHRHMVPLAAGSAILYWIALALIWIFHMKSRVVHPKINRYIVAFGITVEFMLITTLVKYEVLGFPALTRYLWYLYYLPFLLMPTILLVMSFNVYSTENEKMKKLTGVTFIIPSILFLFVITNDLHFLVFKPTNGFENIENEYKRMIIYFLVLAWIVVCVVSFYVILFVKSRTFRSKEMVILPITALIFAAVLFAVNFAGLDKKVIGYTLINPTEIIMISFIVLIESCADAGIFPTNYGYNEIIRHSALTGVITDTSGNTVYSGQDPEIPAEILSLPNENNTTVIGSEKFETRTIKGGKVIWKEDISEILEKNDALADIVEQLSEEADIARLEIEHRKETEEVKSKNEIFNRISEIIKPQTDRILELSECDKSDEEKYRNNLCKIMADGAYIKRRANLELISSDADCLEFSDLEVSVNEVLYYLGFCNCECSSDFSVQGQYTCRSIIDAFCTLSSVVEEMSVSGGTISAAASDDRFVVTYNGKTAESPLERVVSR